METETLHETVVRLACEGMQAVGAGQKDQQFAEIILAIVRAQQGRELLVLLTTKNGAPNVMPGP